MYLMLMKHKKGKRKETKNKWLDLGYYYDQNGPREEKCLGIVKNPTNIDINFQNKIFPKTYQRF